MEKEKKVSFGLAIVAILLIVIIATVYLIKPDAGKEVWIEELPEKSKEQENVIVLAEKETKEGIFEYQGEMPDIWGKEPHELYEEAFFCEEIKTENAHYYMVDGTLFFDEYTETGEFDEEGLAIYEWRKEQKIADNVIYVDYNDYSYSNNAIYITTEGQLLGTGIYSNIVLEDVKFARAYEHQLIALKTDGSLWCLGYSYSLSDGRELRYQEWQRVLEDVVYASLGHYLYMAITSDGSLYMWGDNTYGQFGDGTLLKEESDLLTEVYFYPNPVKVADGIKMVWSGMPGKQYSSTLGGRIPLRTYMLTQEDELYVCGEEVDEEIRTFYYFGELGPVEEGYDINGSSRLYKVECKK